MSWFGKALWYFVSCIHVIGNLLAMIGENHELNFYFKLKSCIELMEFFLWSKLYLSLVHTYFWKSVCLWTCFLFSAFLFPTLKIAFAMYRWNFFKMSFCLSFMKTLKLFWKVNIYFCLYYSFNYANNTCQIIMSFLNFIVNP